jgi:hypothetical protein
MLPHLARETGHRSQQVGPSLPARLTDCEGENLVPAIIRW